MVLFIVTIVNTYPGLPRIILFFGWSMDRLSVYSLDGKFLFLK